MRRRQDRGPGRLWLGLLIALGLRGAPAFAQTLAVSAVPYLPQSEALCGGAALAMVLRYWGVPGVAPEDFAASLTPEGTGIPAPELARLAEARGFRAFPFRGTREEVISHLERGRPLIALLGAAPGRHHYVVVLAWANGRVLVHDPAIGPFRTIAESEWQRRAAAAGRWALLVLPGKESVGPAPASALAPPQDEDACMARARPLLDLAVDDDPDAAKQHWAKVAATCPDSSAPLREMAALEFRRERWTSAAELAAEAVQRDPADRFGWKLLATSRFLAGQRPEALRAWNQIDEPRLDLVQINGFHQTPAHLAYAYLGESPGTLLTPDRVRLVQRRIDALPAAQLASVTYRPQSGGTAELDVNVVERPAFTSLRSMLVASALRAAFERAIAVEAFGLAPSGDSVHVSGYWRSQRSRGLLSASAPHFLGLPGVVTAEALWDEQSYHMAPVSLAGPPVRERRARASASLAHWWTADTRVTVTAAGDEWMGRGRYLSLGSAVEQRMLRDHVALRGGVGGWWSGASGPFYVASARGSARTAATPERPRLLVDVSYDLASARAPLALWPGAGTGSARPALLRAHPLVRDGVIAGPAFGSRLLSGTTQGEVPLGSLGPATLRAAVFVDAAKVLAPTRGVTLVDVGVGLRVQPAGRRSWLRLDLATPWGRLQPQLSAGWQTEWP